MDTERYIILKCYNILYIPIDSLLTGYILDVKLVFYKYIKLFFI